MNGSRLQRISFLALLNVSAACSLLAPNDSDLLGAGAAPAAGGSTGTAGADGQAGSAAGGTAAAGGDGAPSTGGSAGIDGASGSGGSASIDGASASGGSANPIDAADADTGSGSLVPQRSLVLWLTADDGVTTIGGAVSAWSDKSPSGANATQSIAVSRPDFSREGDLDSVAFDGIDDSLV